MSFFILKMCFCRILGLDFLIISSRGDADCAALLLRTQDASDNGSERAASAASMGAADAAILRRVMPVRQQPHQGLRRRRLEHARARWTGHHRKVRLLL